VEEEYLKKKFDENYEKCTKEFANLPLHLKEEIDAITKKNNFGDFYDAKMNPQAL